MTPRCPALVMWYRADAIKLARYLARRYRYDDRGDYDDINSEALIGLMHGIDLYDPAHEGGACLWTYAAIWVRARVERYMQWRRSGPATISRKLRCRAHGPRTHAVDIEGLESEHHTYLAHGTIERSIDDSLDTASQLSHVWEIAERVLSKRALAILRDRAGGATLEIVADRYGVTRQRIAEIESESHDKIKLAIRRSGRRA